MNPFLLNQSNPIQSNPWMDPIHVQLWYKYLCTTTNQQHTKSNSNPNPNPNPNPKLTTKQHVVVSIHLNIVTRHMCPKKFT